MRSKRFVLKTVAWAAASAAAAFASAPVAAQVPQPLAQAAALEAGAVQSAQRSVRVIVQFDAAPVLEMRQGMNVYTAGKGEMAAYAEQLLAAKAAPLAVIRSLGGRVQNTTEFALNAAMVDIDRNQIERIRQIAGVKSAREAKIYTMSQAAPPTVPQLIGTAAVNAGGNTGAGVAIAVIDSGVDFTHASFNRTPTAIGLGTTGTTALYTALVAGTRPTTLTDSVGLFPASAAQVLAGPATAPQVVGGFDWLGDTWTGSAGGLNVTPDPNPIDNKQLSTDFAGHGTNSASAAAGQAVPAGGLLAGSAPGAWILAYRGCSRISRSCEGSALLNSVDSAVRYAAGFPNGGQPGANNPLLPAGTRIVINMSLGAEGGNPMIDDLSEASRIAVRGGVTVVASAGNSGDTPFIVGTPSSADTVISVAASQPATLTGPALQVGAPLNTSYPMGTAAFGPAPTGTVFLESFGFAGPNVTAGSNTNIACSTVNTGLADPGPANPAIPALGSATGIADRGTCQFAEKALNIQRAGGSFALIVNNAANGGPFGMAAGAAGASVTIPTFSLGTSDGASLKQAFITSPTLQGTVLPFATLPNGTAPNLVDLISDFSSRGPVQNGSALKPDITAPGSNIYMATIGTGTGGAPSSGTSFSGPLTAGAAALVLAKFPSFTPWQVKAALMNTADPSVFAIKTATTSTLAPLTRMGAGRLRADLATGTGTLAHDSEDIDPSTGTYFNTALSFGPQAFTSAGTTTVARTVVVRNLGATAKTYAISVAPRFSDDLAKGVVFSTSTTTLVVAGNSTGSFQVTGTTTGSALPTSVNAIVGLPFPSKLSVADGCTTAATCASKFTNLEQDGFVTINGGATDTVRVPYLMVPRLASNVGTQRVGAAMLVRNLGAGNTFVDVFNMLGTVDPQDQPATVPGTEVLNTDIKEIGVRFTPNAITGTLPAGVTSGDLIEFAVSTYQPLSTPRQGIFNFEIDTNNDGVADFRVNSLTTTTGTNTVFIAPVTAGVAGTPANNFFGTTGDFNSGKFALPAFASLMGITSTSRIGVRAYTTTYLGDAAVDRSPDSGGFVYVNLGQLVNTPTVRSFVSTAGSSLRLGFGTNAANSTASPGDKGILLIYGDNPVGSETQSFQLVR